MLPIYEWILFSLIKTLNEKIGTKLKVRGTDVK